MEAAIRAPLPKLHPPPNLIQGQKAREKTESKEENGRERGKGENFFFIRNWKEGWRLAEETGERVRVLDKRKGDFLQPRMYRMWIGQQST